MSARVTSVVLVDGSIERVTEPDWCTGVHEPGLGREDMFHVSQAIELDVATRWGVVGVLEASLTAYPFAATAAGRIPMASVSMEAAYYSFDPNELRTLAGGLVEHAGNLRTLAALLERVRAEVGR